MHLLRQEYGTASLMAQNDGFWADGFLHFLATVPSMLSWVFAFFAAAGFVLLLKKVKLPSRPAVRGGVFEAAVAIGFLFTGVVFSLLFNIPEGGLAKMVVERFFALPIVVAAFPVAEVFRRLERVLPGKGAFPALCALLVVLHALNQWPASDRSGEWFYEAHIRNVFQTVEEDAVILTWSDANHFGMVYGRESLGLGDGVDFIQIGLWGLEWYRRDVFEEMGLVYPDGRPPALAGVIEFIKKRRPVYTFIAVGSEVTPHLAASYPVGPLVRLAADVDDVPEIAAVYEKNANLFRAYRLPSREGLLFLNRWEKSMQTAYRRPWNSLAAGFESAGMNNLAALSRSLEDEMSPLYAE